MLDPTALIFATQETRRLSNSAGPDAPVVAEERRPARLPAARPLATLLRAAADRLDGGQGRLARRVDAV